MMMENLWAIFCGKSTCARSSFKHCNARFVLITRPSSCINHASILCFDTLLLVMLLYNFICKHFSKKLEQRARSTQFSILQLLSAVFNGSLGLVYLGFGIWKLDKKLTSDHFISPNHWWILFFFHGVTWLLVGLTISLKGELFTKLRLRVLSILAFLFTGIFCFLAVFTTRVHHKVTDKVVLDILSFVGASLLLLCAYKGHTPNMVEIDSSKINSTAQATPFAKSGLFSKMSFCWLNPLMKLGKKKILEEDDIPKLRDIDMAESCYSRFMDQLIKHKQAKSSPESSILWTIVACYREEIMKSGFFALLKILSISAGPLLLNSIILVAEGKEDFRYQGYLLAVLLFFLKMMESLSQRQWYFKTRLIGLNVKSILTAAIYRKQLRLSNGSRKIHSGGTIMNYVTVDAYRIGEFPFWFHQTWTAVLQLCFALVIMIHSVGLATIASLVVIILTVICNTPLAKLQHKFQSTLIAAQDDRLKACSEALVNMKVLKLYAWEVHFKNIIEALRKVEYKCISAVQLQKAYHSYLFWGSPLMVNCATFGACYLLKIPLHASNVFTFLATLQLVQEPIRLIPNLISVVIHARLSFARIVKFLESPELHIENVRKKCNLTSTNPHVILMKSANLSWETNPSKPTLRNINLNVLPGEKVAICGEVGSGKSTLLAGILGEVPYIDGTVCFFKNPHTYCIVASFYGFAYLTIMEIYCRFLLNPFLSYRWKFMGGLLMFPRQLGSNQGQYVRIFFLDLPWRTCDTKKQFVGVH
ncbi:hypothetical protein BVRB_3g052740 [Beta vulgaris subsp. vulgaris]|nr:hypothetical protein BVRB_3g052740 [Beta vulgaris subsp. vulgaris]